jgi:hypothetical protein
VAVNDPHSRLGQSAAPVAQQERRECTLDEHNFGVERHRVGVAYRKQDGRYGEPLTLWSPFWSP